MQENIQMYKQIFVKKDLIANNLIRKMHKEKMYKKNY